MLERKVPDTVPIYIRGVNPFGDRMNWMGRHHPSYERLRRLVLEDTDIFHGVGYDTGAFLSAASGRASLIREEEEWRDEEHVIETPRGPIRNLVRHSRLNGYEVMEVEFYIKDVADYDRFMSAPYSPVRCEVRVELAARDSEVGDHGLPFVSLPSAVGYLHLLLGSEGLALWSVMERERLLALARMLRDRIVEFTGYLLSQGAGPVFSYGGPELAVPPLMSPRDFRELFTEIDKPIHDLVHSRGCYTWVHCHGTLDKVLEDFAEVGVDILEPVEAPPGGDVALSDAKRRIGDRTILMGNMPYEAIISWTPARIEERVKADCEAAMTGGGFIMMPAASPFEPELSDEGYEGFRAYVAAGREYGRYS